MIVSRGIRFVVPALLICLLCAGPLFADSLTYITRAELTTSQVAKQPPGRNHPEYTNTFLMPAIAEGVDRGGNTLDYSMPRYTMASEDSQSLAASLKVPGSSSDPGITESAIRLGTIVLDVPREDLRHFAVWIGPPLTGCLEEHNADGGIFNRRIEVVVKKSDGTQESLMAAAKELIQKEGVFAIIAPFISGADKEVPELAEKEGVPLVCPYTFYPEDASARRRFTFYLLSGIREQMLAQVAYARSKFPEASRSAIIYADEGLFAEIALSVEEKAKASKLAVVARDALQPDQSDFSGLTSKLKAEGAEIVFFLSAGKDMHPFLEAAARIEWSPIVLFPGASMRREVLDLPLAFKDRLFAALPSVPADYSLNAIQHLNVLRTKYPTGRGGLPAEAFACSAAKIMIEGLRRAGPNLSREKLVASLDQLQDFNTGLAPPVSYNQNRRIGALGAHIMVVDLEEGTLKPAGGWISLE